MCKLKLTHEFYLELLYSYNLRQTHQHFSTLHNMCLHAVAKWMICSKRFMLNCFSKVGFQVLYFCGHMYMYSYNNVCVRCVCVCVVCVYSHVCMVYSHVAMCCDEVYLHMCIYLVYVYSYV